MVFSTGSRQPEHEKLSPSAPTVTEGRKPLALPAEVVRYLDVLDLPNSARRASIGVLSSSFYFNIGNQLGKLYIALFAGMLGMAVSAKAGALSFMTLDNPDAPVFAGYGTRIFGINASDEMVVATPEPNGAALFGFGAAFLMLYARRRKCAGVKFTLVL